MLVLAGILVVGFAAWWFLVRSDAPPAPDLASAVETAAAAQQPAATATPSTEAPAATASLTTVAPTTGALTTVAPTTAVPTTVEPPGPSGTWTVDLDIGSFHDFSSTWVGYRIDEELGRGIGAATAVGRTPLVTGTVVLADDAVVSAEITADLRGLKSDRIYRDGKVFDVLHVDRHPEAVFVLDGPLPLVAGITEAAATMPGVLIVNGVAVAVDATLEATLVGDVLTVVGSLPVVLADHGVDAPSAPIVISVADHGVVEFQLFLTRVAATG
jgi:hypothetical protein